MEIPLHCCYPIRNEDYAFIENIINSLNLFFLDLKTYVIPLSLIKGL